MLLIYPQRCTLENMRKNNNKKQKFVYRRDIPPINKFLFFVIIFNPALSIERTGFLAYVCSIDSKV